MEYRIVYNDELYHHGVKGMKWGVRKESNWNQGYSSEQRKRDASVYGSGGVRRINRSMNKGNNISGARSKEAARINSARRKARIGSQIGNAAGTVGGGVAGLILSRYAGKKINDPQMAQLAVPAMTAGMSAAGSQLGRYGGQSVVMLMYGYDPHKYR